MTDPQDVRSLIHWCETNDDPIPDPDEVAQMAYEWLRMKEELERITDMNTDSSEWYQRRARIGLGLEAGEDD